MKLSYKHPISDSFWEKSLVHRAKADCGIPLSLSSMHMEDFSFMEKKVKNWPADCVWPEPVEDTLFGHEWDADNLWDMAIGDEGDVLLEIKEYFDSLVSEGRLDEEYKPCDDFQDGDLDDSADEEWEPEMGEDYWDDETGFDVEGWQLDLNDYINGIKLSDPSPVLEIQQITGYEFINENLLRQAFTRRAFGAEHGVGDSQKLEFIGDSAINNIVTREMAKQLTQADTYKPADPFHSAYDEGDLSRIRSHYVCKEYLSSRAVELGLDKYILYGSGEQPSESAREDMMEALVGAVAVDCNWDNSVLESVVDALLCVQLSDAHTLLSRPFYDIFNAWHQKRIGVMPKYEVRKTCPENYLAFTCTLRYFLPENDKGLDRDQRVEVRASTRSKARELAAEFAYRHVVNNGLWLERLEESGIVPSLDDSINQLQELYQKKYVDKPDYCFEENHFNEWRCTCKCSDIEAWASGKSKILAKKQAAFDVLKKLMPGKKGN